MEHSRGFGLIAAGVTLLLSGCATTVANFDTLPNGTSVMGQAQPVLQGNSVSAQSLISNQYASEGLLFSSGGPAVFAAGFFQNDAPSAPNAACPIQANGTAGFSSPTEIKVTRNNICNIWVTITKTSGPTMMKAFDVSGNQIGPTVNSSGSAPGRPGVAETLHINACNIDRVMLSGTNYCFDDVTIRE